MTDTSTVETDNAESAGADDNQSLLSAKPVETNEAAPADEVPHLVRESDSLVEEQSEQPAERPANIPEQFWKDGSVDTDAMAKAYSDLRSKMDSGKHKAPKDGKYSLDAVEGVDAEDPTLGEFLEIARDEGLSQGAFERLTNFYMQQMGALDEEITYRRDQEMAKLGRNADKVIASMDNWLTKMNTAGVLSAAEMESIANASTNATFISALNKIRRSYNEPDIPRSDVVEPDAITMDDIQVMMADPKYGVDPAFTRQVERKVYEMHGEKL
jgi:hypothetical protein